MHSQTQFTFRHRIACAENCRVSIQKNISGGCHARSNGIELKLLNYACGM